MKELYDALNKFQANYKQVKFDATVKVRLKSGGEYTFEYATLAHITEELRPLWVKHGLSLVQTFDGPHLITRLQHISGESLISSIPLKMEGTNQEQGAEISYKRRYAVACILGVVADEDDDSNTTAAEGFTKHLTPKSREPKGKNAGLPWDGAYAPSPVFSDKFVQIEKAFKDAATSEWLQEQGKTFAPEIKKLPENEQNILRKLFKERAETIKKIEEEEVNA